MSGLIGDIGQRSHYVSSVGDLPSRINISPQGNVGIGVRPRSDWRYDGGSERTGLQIGPRTTLWGEVSGNNTLFGHNVYETSSGYAGLANANCTMFLMSNGELNYRTGTNSAGVGGTVTMSNKFIVNIDGLWGVGCSPATWGIKLDGVGNSGLFTGGEVSCGSFTNRSDERLKKNITSLESGLDIVNKLNPVTYNLKRTEFSSEDHAGFIAQEVKKVFPLGVKGDESETEKVFDQDGTETGVQPVYMGIKVMEIIALMTKSIQELSAKVTALEKE